MLTEERGGRQLAAGHAVRAVVHEHRGDALATRRGVDDLGRADGREVAVALVGQHERLGPHPPDPRRDGRGATVLRLEEVEMQVVVGEHRATHGGDRDRPPTDAQFLEHLGHEPVDHAVPAARAVVRGLVLEQRRSFEDDACGQIVDGGHRVGSG